MSLMLFGMAAAGGWAADEFCGNGLRPFPRPGPGPWPWLLSRVIAAIGGAITWYLVSAAPDADTGILTAAVAGGVGGVVLSSLFRGFTGGAAAAVDRQAGP
jgi:hypothetical protein